MMRGILFLLALTQVPLGSASSNCPLYGPEFPPPQRLSEHPIWKAALANLTGYFDWLDASNTTGINGFSYSYQVFSTSPGPGILWERHITAKTLPANTTGVKKVDGDTVYRLGSVTKILSILTWLAEVGDVDWNSPITKFIPELAEAAAKQNATGFDPIKNTAWDDITIGALASQISGLGRDYGAQGEVLETPDLPSPQAMGFPVLPASELPPCGTYPICTKQQFLKGVTDAMYPSYGPYTTATYSNMAYQLLAYALENITGKKFEDLLTDKIIKGLGLNRTYYNTPPDSVGIIPGSYKDTYWNVPLGDASPTGNAYSSANDLSAIGRAILSYKILKPALTRRWLQPASFVSDIVGSLGAPWGIRRMEIQPDTQPKRTITAYTKAGTFQVYTAFLSLIPDYSLGFTIMMAGKLIFPNFNIADVIGSVVIPAYNSAVRDEANQIYGGTYASKDFRANDTSTYSFINFSVDPAKPGLAVNYWYQRGVDMMTEAIELVDGVVPTKAEAHLQWTQLESTTADGGKRQAWKAVFEDTTGPEISGLGWTTTCGTWIAAAGSTYGNLPLDEFIFNFDKNGNVVSVDNAALRQTLYKVGVNGTSTNAALKKMAHPNVPANSTLLTTNKYRVPALPKMR